MVESRQVEALAVTVLFPVLAAVFVIARTYSRYLGQNFGWDDWLIYISLFLLVGQTITIYEFIKLSGTGYHIYDLPKRTVAQQVLAAKWSFAVQLFYHPLMGAIRASIIMFLFRVKDKRVLIRVALHVVFWINIGYMVSTTFVNIFQCTPVRYAYMRAAMDQVGPNGTIIKGGKCIDSLKFILSSCGLSIFMDLIIIPIPTAMVWDLHMRRKTKFAVVVIMSMGWIATAVSVGRFVVYYYRFLPTNTDRTWDIGVVISIVEPAVGIIAACAPAMKCLFRIIVPRYFSENETTYQGHSRNTSKTAPKISSDHQYVMNKDIEDSSYVAIANGKVVAMGRDQDLYGMHPLSSVDSRDQLTRTTSPPPARTRSTKTGHSGMEEAVPAHILNHKH